VKTISKQWIKRKYWDEQKTAEEMAALRGVSRHTINSLIRQYGLQKKKNGLKPKGKIGYTMPEDERAKHRVQKHSKAILVFKGKSKKPIYEFTSITAAANELNLRREHIRDCLNENKQRWSAKGFSFEYKRYRGEILYERRSKLDFSQDCENILKGLTANLPNYPLEERMEHYNRKVGRVLEDLGYIKG